jgi:hypothetical protein
MTMILTVLYDVVTDIGEDPIFSTIERAGPKPIRIFFSIYMMVITIEKELI